MHGGRRSATLTVGGAAVALALAASACASNGPATPTPAARSSGHTVTSRAPSHVRSPSASPTATPASCVDAVFDRLTPAQRVGQLFALGLGGDRLGPAELGAIRSEHVGSVWFTETTTEGSNAVKTVADAVQAQATREATGGVRFYVAANQEGGEIQALRGAGFATIPTAVDQGALDPSVLQGDAAGWGRELSDAGVNLDFAPVMDVVPPGTDSENQPIGVLHREFGHDPSTVAAHGTAFIRGISEAGLATPRSISLAWAGSAATPTTRPAWSTT